MGEENIEWRGLGRWLSLVVAVLLVLSAIPAMFVHQLGAAAGWNIFLGLLLFGVIVAGNQRAPLLAGILAVLMLVRLMAALAIQPSIVDAALNSVLIIMLVIAWRDLRRQSPWA